MDVCALCNLLTVAATASCIQEGTITDTTECMAWAVVLFIDTWRAIKQRGIELGS